MTMVIKMGQIKVTITIHQIMSTSEHSLSRIYALFLILLTAMLFPANFAFGTQPLPPSPYAEDKATVTASVLAVDVDKIADGAQMTKFTKSGKIRIEKIHNYQRNKESRQNYPGLNVGDTLRVSFNRMIYLEQYNPVGQKIYAKLERGYDEGWRMQMKNIPTGADDNPTTFIQQIKKLVDKTFSTVLNLFSGILSGR